MAYSSKGKAKLSGEPHRFNDYLDGIRDEFNLLSKTTTTSGAGRFNTYLTGIKVEFELLAIQVESLQKERDEYKEKVEMQAKELENIRGSMTISSSSSSSTTDICERCSSKLNDHRQIVASTSHNNTKSTKRSLFHFPFSTSQKVDPIQKMTAAAARVSTQVTQRTTTLQRVQKLTPDNTATKPTSSHIASSSSVLLHPPAPPPSPPVKKPKESIWFKKEKSNVEIAPPPPVEKPKESIWFNHEVEKELNVEIAREVSHKRTISPIKFSRDGKYLAAGYWHGITYIYDVQTGALSSVLRNLLSDETITRVCFSSDGKYLATGSSEGHIYIWEIEKKYVRNAFKGHTRWIRHLDFSPNGQLLVSTARDNNVRLWSMRYGLVKALPDQPLFLDQPFYTCAMFSPDGRYIAGSHRDGMVRIWSVRTGEMIRKMRSDVGFTYGVVFVRLGMGLVSGGEDRTLKYWDVGSLYDTRGPRSRMAGEERGRELSGHTRYIDCLSVSADGRWVASGSADQTVRIWDTHKNGAIQCIIKHEDDVFTVDFSPAGFYLASGTRSGTVKIWRCT